MIKKIIIVGGGTAGWLTALKAKRSYPDLDITVIESKEIGILGAGEGSTPFLTDFLNHLDIPLSDLIKDCDATIKNGVKFTNWNNDNKFFYHGFAPLDKSLGFDPISERYISGNPLAAASLLKNNNLNEIDFAEKISEKNKVPFTAKNNKTSFGFVAEKEGIHKYDQVSFFSIHFNAVKLANKLKEIGLSRGIKLIEGTIINVSLDQDNNVESLTLENNEKVYCDFIFDCSGFHRLIIGKVFNAKWKSYKNFLPEDSAIPFFIEMTEEIPSYTEAIAMKYGWIWKIPLQDRFGCGYVYDSSLISEEDAVKEIEEFLGYEPKYPRKDKGGFKFDAGAYEEPWTNNCIAVGLAANFVEPLEATSIWVSIVALTQIFSNPAWLVDDSQARRDEFNNVILNMNNDVSNFIYFHYMSFRKDTKFWEKFSYENAPEELKSKIDLWQHRLPGKFDNGDYWIGNSWLLVGASQGTVSVDMYKQYLELSKDYQRGLDMYDYFVNYQNYKVLECIDHKEFLESLK